jgi:hypothetical protein
MVFYECGSIIGNNTIDRTCNSIGGVFNLPMFYTELIYNSYIVTVVNRIIGIPTVLNCTKQIMRRHDLDSEEAIKLFYDSQKNSIIKSIKFFLVKKLGGRCT